MMRVDDKEMNSVRTHVENPKAHGLTLSPGVQVALPTV